MDRHERRGLDVGESAAVVVLFGDQQFHGGEQTRAEIVSQHGDGDQRVAQHNAQQLCVDASDVDPPGVIQQREQHEPAAPDAAADAVLVFVPIGGGTQVVGAQRCGGVTDVGEQVGDEGVEVF